MLRMRAWAALVAAVAVVGCSGERERPMEPATGPALFSTVGVNDIRAMISALVPPGARGDIQGQFGKVEEALLAGNQTALLAAALEFQRRLLDLLGDDPATLTLPTGHDTLEEAVLHLLNTVFAYAGLTNLVIEVPSTGEFVIELVDEDTDQWVKTQPVGFGGMYVSPNSFSGPTLIVISKLNNNRSITLPNGYDLIPPPFDFSASSQPQAPVTISICAEDGEDDNRWVFHETVSGQVAVRLARMEGHGCPEPHASLNSSSSSWAQGLSAAGSFLSSVFGPKVAIAGHAGIAGSTISLSLFGVGEREDSYVAAAVRTNDKGKVNSPTSVTFARTGDMVLWITVANNGVVACHGAVQMQAREGGTGAHTGGTNVGPWTNAESCAPVTVGGVTHSSAYKITLPNIRNGTNTAGDLHFTVDGVAGSNVIRFNTVR